MIQIRDSVIRGELIIVDTILKRAGFTVSKTCCSRPSCFDLVARKDQDVLFVKMQVDVNSVSSTDSNELRSVSDCFSAVPLLLGEKTHEKPLEDDTVYSRYRIPVLTERTLEGILLRKDSPLIRASPGGYYVEIDGEAIRKKRQELGLSVGEAAEIIGISRRTLYGYEREMAKASVAVAYKLIWALGIPVARPMNILEFSKNRRECFLFSSAKRALTRNNVLRRISRVFRRCHVTAFKKAPFDFVISSKDDFRIIGGLACKQDRTLDERINEILSVSRVVGAQSFLVTEGHDISKKEIPCISSDEISKFEDPKDLIGSI